MSLFRRRSDSLIGNVLPDASGLSSPPPSVSSATVPYSRELGGVVLLVLLHGASLVVDLQWPDIALEALVRDGEGAACLLGFIGAAALGELEDSAVQSQLGLSYLSIAPP